MAGRLPVQVFNWHGVAVHLVRSGIPVHASIACINPMRTKTEFDSRQAVV
jgi:hypothetical protein